jgi:hypothetical protein
MISFIIVVAMLSLSVVAVPSLAVRTVDDVRGRTRVQRLEHHGGGR